CRAAHQPEPGGRRRAVEDAARAAARDGSQEAQADRGRHPALPGRQGLLRLRPAVAAVRRASAVGEGLHAPRRLRARHAAGLHLARSVNTGVAGLSRRALLAGGAVLSGAGLLRPAPAGAAAADLDFASAVAAADAIRRGQISSVELTTRMLDRIARFTPKLNAVVTLTADAALARAKAADEARGRGEWWGRFHGVPCTVKDTLETAGVRTTAGSPQYSSHVPTRDAAIVARLRAAGVVIMGKTNVPPLAADWQSANPIFGVSNNPWDVTRTPGGSTGGGAAALAAGLTFLEPGSDIGGSIRIPAHFCGVYGHKPTINVIPQRGHIPPPPGLIVPPPALPVVGPLARSAADLLAATEEI